MTLISIIVATAKNHAIGKDNNLLWHISGDLRFFKRTTTGHPVIMGYNTWLSLGGRPLPGRRNIVVSRSHSADADCGAEFMASLEEALSQAAGTDPEEVFVIGGGQIYRAALPLADKLYVTEVDTVIEDADTFFPELDPASWKETSRSESMHDDKSGYDYSFVTYTRP